MDNSKMLRDDRVASDMLVKKGSRTSQLDSTESTEHYRPMAVTQEAGLRTQPSRSGFKPFEEIEIGYGELEHHTPDHCFRPCDFGKLGELG